MVSGNCFWKTWLAATYDQLCELFNSTTLFGWPKKSKGFFVSGWQKWVFFDPKVSVIYSFFPKSRKATTASHFPIWRTDLVICTVQKMTTALVHWRASNVVKVAIHLAWRFTSTVTLAPWSGGDGKRKDRKGTFTNEFGLGGNLFFRWVSSPKCYSTYGLSDWVYFWSTSYPGWLISYSNCQ